MTRFGSKTKSGRDWFFNFLFPKNCLGCAKEGEWLCAKCRVLLKVKSISECLICRRPQITAKVCDHCRGKSPLDGLWVMADFEDKLIKQIIHLIKYNFVLDLAEVFDEMMKNYFSRVGDWRGSFPLLPVPLHRRRFLERGFNQAELVAESASRILGNEISEPILKRKRYLKPQAKLSLSGRLKNIKGNFGLMEAAAERFSKDGIILVDDVYTSGATMQEGAKILKENGFKEVWGLVVARG